MKRLLYFICLTILVISCNNTKDEKTNPVQEESGDQTELMQSYNKADSLFHKGIINQELFDNFITQSIKYADLHPEDEITPDMLSKAGVACMILAKNASKEQNPDQKIVETYAHKGLSIFEKIQATYPDYEGIKNCYLNRAFIYEDILQKYLDAEYVYRDFLHKYPDDPMCESIRANLEILGKSEEEIMAAIKKK